ncbi:MAG TPA: histidine triad nucleotide-binding protein [Actinospica sp.]|nr:histidine triad nucleotide-binding protein [Actinospica sp.]
MGQTITASGESDGSGTTSDAGCIFCSIIAGRIPSTLVRETERTFAFRDIAPQAPVHVLVIPKTHAYADAAQLAAGDPGLAAELLREAGEVAKAEGLAEAGYRIVFNTGDHAGQTVYHVHAHVLGGEPLGRFGTPR